MKRNLNIMQSQFRETDAAAVVNRCKTIDFTWFSYLVSLLRLYKFSLRSWYSKISTNHLTHKRRRKFTSAKYRQISFKDTFSDCQDPFINNIPAFFLRLLQSPRCPPYFILKLKMTGMLKFPRLPEMNPVKIQAGSRKKKQGNLLYTGYLFTQRKGPGHRPGRI